MPNPAITLEVLPAGFGDCLLVSCPVGRRTWRMLVDTGPDECYPALQQRLSQIPPSADGKRHIDLFVVTHIDHDHIGGAGRLLNDAALSLSFGDIWFNAPPKPTVRGVAEGHALAKLLGADAVTLPWNRAWSGKNVSTPADGGGVQLGAKGLPRLTLLSPTPDRLRDLFKVWDKELGRLRGQQRDLPEAAPPAIRGPAATQETLADKVTAIDKAIPNGSSIAFLLEHKGASILLCADAHPTVLVPALKALADRRAVKGPLKVDAIKLSHHGSRANVTKDLLGAVVANHYIVSTNNTYFNHPDEEAMARVIVGGKGRTLWFNYDTARNRLWAKSDLLAKYEYQAKYPNQDGVAVTVNLAARPTRRTPLKQG